MALPAMRAAVAVERRQAGQCGCLFTAERAQFGQTNENGQGGALADAGDAEHEFEAGLEIIVALEGDKQAASSASRRRCSRVISRLAKQRRRGGRSCSRRVFRRTISSSICSIKVR
jgi:hypothetical protein